EAPYGGFGVPRVPYLGGTSNGEGTHHVTKLYLLCVISASKWLYFLCGLLPPQSGQGWSIILSSTFRAKAIDGGTVGKARHGGRAFLFHGMGILPDATWSLFSPELGYGVCLARRKLTNVAALPVEARQRNTAKKRQLRPLSVH